MKRKRRPAWGRSLCPKCGNSHFIHAPCGVRIPVSECPKIELLILKKKEE